MTISTTFIAAGESYRCRFGTADAPATVDAKAGTVTCVSPMRGSGLVPATVMIGTSGDVPYASAKFGVARVEYYSAPASLFVTFVHRNPNQHP
jgi:hypothetical protein